MVVWLVVGGDSGCIKRSPLPSIPTVDSGMLHRLFVFPCLKAHHSPLNTTCVSPVAV